MQVCVLLLGSLRAGQFKPEHFDPDKWAALAKDGGARYMVLTARHQDESALFDDSGSSFAAVKSAAVLHGAQVRFRQSERRLEMDLPAAPVEGVDAILKLELEQPWTTQAVIPVPSS